MDESADIGFGFLQIIHMIDSIKKVLLTELNAVGVCDARGVAQAVEQSRSLRIAVITTHLGFVDWMNEHREVRVRQFEDATENAFRVSDMRQLRGLNIAGVEVWPPYPPDCGALLAFAETRIR